MATPRGCTGRRLLDKNRYLVICLSSLGGRSPSGNSSFSFIKRESCGILRKEGSPLAGRTNPKLTNTSKTSAIVDTLLGHQPQKSTKL